MTTTPDFPSHRIANVTADAIARGAAVDMWSRAMRGRAYVVVAISHRSRPVPHFSAAPTLEAACERAARTVARLPWGAP